MRLFANIEDVSAVQLAAIISQLDAIGIDITAKPATEPEPTTTGAWTHETWQIANAIVLYGASR